MLTSLSGQPSSAVEVTSHTDRGENQSMNNQPKYNKGDLT